MKCEFCKMNPDHDMEGVASYDNPCPSEGDIDPKNIYAYNVHQCHYCGALCKEDVWHNKGRTWLLTDGRIVKK